MCCELCVLVYGLWFVVYSLRFMTVVYSFRFMVYGLGRGNALVATLAKLLPEEKLHLIQGLGFRVHG